MARPRTTGDPITFRLPVEQHEFVAERAKAKGVTVNEYVRAAYTRSVEAAMEKSTVDETLAPQPRYVKDPRRTP